MEKDQIIATELGRVIVDSRARLNALREPYKDFLWEWSLRGFIHSKKIPQEERMRYQLSYDYFRSHFFSGFHSAILFKKYFSLFVDMNEKNAQIQRLDDRYDELENNCHFVEIADHAIEQAHTSADVISIELYNAFKIINTKEFNVSMNIGDKLISEEFCFIFPNLIKARDAVVHSHDRSLGSFKDSQVSSSPVHAPIFSNGKKYFDEKLTEFSFNFEEDQFIRALDMLKNSL